MSIIIFIHQLAFVVISPSLWFYLLYLEKTHYYGVVWASYFIGQACFTPIWKWSKRINFTISTILGILSGFIYCYPNIYTIIIARFIQGMASSNIASSISQTCQISIKQRSKNLTSLFLWQNTGYLIGPAVGWILSYIPTTLIFWPGYCGLFISLCYLILQIIALFWDFEIFNTTEEGLLDIRINTNKIHSNLRLLIFNINSFFFFFLLSIYDCLITPITLYYYHYDFYIQILCWMVVGSLIFFSFILLSKLINIMSTMVLYQLYLTLQFIGLLLLLPMSINIFMVALGIISFSLSGCLVLNLFVYSKEVRPNENNLLLLYLMVGGLGRAMGSLFFQFLYQDLYQIFVSLNIFSFTSLLLLSLANILSNFYK